MAATVPATDPTDRDLVTAACRTQNVATPTAQQGGATLALALGFDTTADALHTTVTTAWTPIEDVARPTRAIRHVAH